MEDSEDANYAADLLLDDNVFHNACGSGIPAEGNPEPQSQASSSEDPFTKLQNLMTASFASMRSDSLVLSGQLGMLQPNVATLSTTVATMKSDFSSINNRLNGVSSQAEDNQNGIEGLNKKISNMQASQAALLEEKVSESVAKEIARAAPAPSVKILQQMDKMSKELDRLKAVSAVKQMAGARDNGGSRASVRSEAEDDEKLYWAARKKLRLSPVVGKDTPSLMMAAYAFLGEKMSIPTTELQEGAIIDVKKVSGRRRAVSQNEVVITCDSVQTRDCFASYAANLAQWRGV